MFLYDGQGSRKYLTPAERQRFLSASTTFDEKVQTLCWTLTATGCRISEALSLSGHSIDIPAKMVIIESLKKRRRGVYRAVPIEDQLVRRLIAVHSLGGSGDVSHQSLWPWCRVTAYRHVNAVMKSAGLCGSHAMPKGLRHGFGVAAIDAGIPLNMVQRWLGHADMRTTAIYTGAIGAEERSIASRMWLNSVAAP